MRKSYDALNGRRVAQDVFSKETGEVVIEVGERINIDIIDLIKEDKIKEVVLIEFPNNKDDAYLSQTLDIEAEFIKKNLKLKEEDVYTPSELALLTIHAIMRPGEPTNIDNARSELERLFFNPRTYSLGSVGRYKINQKFGFEDIEVQTLIKDDIIYTIKYLLFLIAEADGYYIESSEGSKKGKGQKTCSNSC